MGDPSKGLRGVGSSLLSYSESLGSELRAGHTRAVRFWKKFGPVLGLGEVPGHIWMGTSVESQEVDYRVRHLKLLPARLRFLSCEPLLGPIALDLEGIHWVIAGGESGPVRRAMEPAWAESIRDQCVRHRVPFFFKQWGGRTPKAGGRELGGREWSERAQATAP